MFDGKGNRQWEIQEGKWQLANLTVCNNDFVQTVQIYFDIIDPVGNKRSGEYYGDRIGGILKAMKFLKEASRFYNLEHLKLYEENQKLTREIEKLKNQISSLLEGTATK